MTYRQSSKLEIIKMDIPDVQLINLTILITKHR